MAEAALQVQISALDGFSATLAKFRQDLMRSEGATGALARGVRQIDLKPDFSGAIQQFEQFQTRARGALGAVAGIVPALGVIGAAGSLVGLSRMASSVSAFGVELGNAAQMAGTTAAGLNSLQGAARLSGVSAGVATQALSGLNATLAAATFGRAPQAVALFEQLGNIQFRNLDGSARRAEEVLPQLSNEIAKLAKIDPRSAARVLEGLGISPEALPLLGLGAEKISELRKEWARLSGVNDEGTAASRRFTEAQARLEGSTEKLGRTIVTALEPALTPLIRDLSEFVAKHDKDIADLFTGVGRSITGFDWRGAGDSIATIATSARSAAGAFGEWMAAANRLKLGMDWLPKLLDRIEAAGKSVGAHTLSEKLGLRRPEITPYGIATPREAQGSSTREGQAGSPPADPAEMHRDDVRQKLAPTGQWFYDNVPFMRRTQNWLHGYRSSNPGGVPVREGAGQAGQGGQPQALDNEQQGQRAQQAMDFFRSRGWTTEQAAGIVANIKKESNFNENAVGDGGKAHGIAQWHPDRQAEFTRWSGRSIKGSSYMDQLEHIDFEMRQGRERAAGEALRRSTTAGQSGATVSLTYERPADAAGEANRRARLAEEYARRYPGAAGPSPGAADPSPGSAPGAAPGAVVASPGAPAPRPMPGQRPPAPEEPDLTRGGRVAEPLVRPTPDPAPRPGQNNDGRSRVAVDLTFTDAPPGMRHRASTQGDGVEMGGVTIRRALPTTAPGSPPA